MRHIMAIEDKLMDQDLDELMDLGLDELMDRDLDKLIDINTQHKISLCISLANALRVPEAHNYGVRYYSEEIEPPVLAVDVP